MQSKAKRRGRYGTIKIVINNKLLLKTFQFQCRAYLMYWRIEHMAPGLIKNLEFQDIQTSMHQA